MVIGIAHVFQDVVVVDLADAVMLSRNMDDFQVFPVL
jgi:hypothetical protein